MHSSENLVEIRPVAGILFFGPFTEDKPAELRLINPSGDKITFKLKSTRDRLRMRPAFGYLEPKSQKTVRLVCLAFNDKKLSTADRYTVCVAKAPTEAPDHASQLWRPDPPDVIRRHVLPVMYVKESVFERQPCPQADKQLADMKKDIPLAASIIPPLLSSRAQQKNDEELMKTVSRTLSPTTSTEKQVRKPDQHHVPTLDPEKQHKLTEEQHAHIVKKLKEKGAVREADIHSSRLTSLTGSETSLTGSDIDSPSESSESSSKIFDDPT